MATELRELRESDLEDVSCLIARVFERPIPADGPARLRWLLFENPHATDEMVKGWVLWDSDQAVGFLANVARRMTRRGEGILAACTAKFVTMPTHGVQGLMLAKAFFDQPLVDCLLCATGSKESEPVLQRFGAQKIEGGNEAALFVLRSGPVVVELLRRRGWRAELARLISVVAAGPIRLRNLAYRPRTESDCEVGVERAYRFDSRTDRFGQAAGRDFPITSHRDSEHLNWLFINGPRTRPTTLIYQGCRKNEFVGYLVCQDRHGHTELRRRHVMDVFTAKGDDQAFKALVMAAFHQARQDGMDTLEFRSLPRELLDKLVSWGAWHRRLDVNPFLIKFTSANGSLSANEPKHWYLTPSDGDGAAW